MYKLVYSEKVNFKNDVICYSNLNIKQGTISIENIKKTNKDTLYIRNIENYREDNILKIPENITFNNTFIKNDINIETNNILEKGYLYFEKNLIVKDVNNINNIFKKHKFNIKNNLNVNNLSIIDQNEEVVLKKNYISYNNNNNIGIYSNNNFIVENESKINNIVISNNLSTKSLKYKSINIIDKLIVKGNLNTYGNFNTKTITSSNDIDIKKDLNIIDSINVASELLLPTKYNINYSTGSIRYNEINKTYECYLKKKWIPFSKKFNSSHDTGIIYHGDNVLANQNNIYILQNNNQVIMINNNQDIMNINKYNLNIFGILDIYSNLNVGDNIKNKYNSNVYGSLNVDNGIILQNNSIFAVVSNYNIIPNQNGLMRYNNKYNILEVFIDKWKPFVNIGNNKNTSEIYLYPLEKNKNYDTIYFNSNHTNILNINLLNTIIKSNHIIINQDLNIKNNCINYNNISSSINNNNNILNLNLNNIIIKKNNNVLVSSSSILKEDIICKNNISITSKFNLKNNSFLFYLNEINTEYKICNIIHNIFNNSIINNKVNIDHYNIENNFTLNTIIIYFNKKIYNTKIFIKISNLIIQEKLVNNSNYIIIDINQKINTNKLFLLIKTDKIDKDIQIKLDVKGSYNKYGQLKREYSNIYINELEDFNTENRIFNNIVNIKENLNLYINNNKYNNIDLLVNKKLLIGKQDINKNNIFNISNNNNTIISYNNNFICFSNINNNNKSLLLIDSNNIKENMIIDKNITNTNNINIYNNTNIVNNLNIENALVFSNKNLKINLNINNNNNLLSLYNINISNNLNIKYNIKTNNYIKNNIIINNNNNIFKIIDNRNLSIHNNQIIQFPLLNNNDNIYLIDNNDIIFKYKNKNIINISNNSLSINIEKNNNNIINTKNFILNTNEFKSNSTEFYVNDTNLYKELTNIEKYYYSIYNIKINSSTTSENFSISYNYPRLNYNNNLNYYINNNQKKIEYIAYQFCGKHVNSHIDNEWNNNSFILYKSIDNISFNNNIILNHNINYPKYNFNKFNNITSNIFTDKFDFYQNNMSFNINLDKNKYQIVGNKEIFNNSDFILKKDNSSKYTLRLYPIYNNNSNIYIYYSDLFHIN